MVPSVVARKPAHGRHGQEISLLEDNSDRLTEAVRDGTVDLALIGTAGIPDGPGALTVAVLSESMAARHRDRLVARAVDDMEAPAVLALVWRPAHSPAVREPIVHARRTFAGPGAAQAQDVRHFCRCV
ncbi:hypothetical protein KRMM14A1259_58800 [Krasilnikovia sp. MM14-A1259]